MAINVSVQYDGGLLPDIILSVDPTLLPSGNPFKYQVPGSGFVFIAYVTAVYYYYHVLCTTLFLFCF